MKKMVVHRIFSYLLNTAQMILDQQEKKKNYV